MWRADLTLALVALVWGTTFVVVKAAVAEISIMYFLALRFGLASLCLLPLLLRVPKVQLAGGLLGGVVTGVFLASGYMLQTFGLRYTTAGNSGFLTGLYIVLVPLLTAALFRRWPRRSEVVGVSMAGLGMLLLTFPHGSSGPGLNGGDILTIGSAIAFAFHLLVLGYYSKRQSVEALAFGQILCTACLAAVALLFESPVVHWSSRVVFAIVVTGVFATALAFVLQTWGQRYTTNTRAAVIFSLEPVFALLAAVVAGGEHVTLAEVGGGGLILAGILLVELWPGHDTPAHRDVLNDSGPECA